MYSYFIFIFTLFLLTNKVSASCNQKFQNADSTLISLLDSIDKITTEKKYGKMYTWHPCKDISGKSQPHNTHLTEDDGKNCNELVGDGETSQLDASLKGNYAQSSAVVTYKVKDATCTGGQNLFVVSVSCNSQITKPVFSKLDLHPSVNVNSCRTDVFIYESMELCHVTKHNTTSGYGFTTFILILVLIVAGYLICGALYNRFVKGAQGFEQVPHYLFWRRLIRNIRSLFPERLSTSSGDYTRPTVHGDDELQYDPPPAVNTNTPPANARAQLNRELDEADVRLLPV